MIKYALLLGIIVCGPFASAEILLDQIGSLKGEGVGEQTVGSQYFEPKYAAYDIAVLDNFTVDAPVNIHTVEVVIDGWNGWSGPDVSAFSINVYSDPQLAAFSLVGDVATAFVEIADATVDPDWFGNGDLIVLPVSLDVETGPLWISVIPENSFVNNGQSGIKDSLIGDGVLGWQANPGGAFSLPDNIEETQFDFAYRLLNTAAPDPCEDDLPLVCPADANGDGSVNVSDLLMVIGSWTECGDETYRPLGDVAPMPAGDCCVNVIDVLAVIDAWNSDCTIYGGCCLGDGTCIELSAMDCAAVSGEYYGNFTNCSTNACVTGACCITDVLCQDVTEHACIAMGASIVDSDDCASADCMLITQGDDCSFTLEAVEGANPFDITEMTASQPSPDPTVCAGTQLNWTNTQQDVWFSFTPTQANNYHFSLCDSDYDTSLVLYEDTCSNQVACNGNATLQQICHYYYSAVNYDLQANVSYLIRIGGNTDAIGTGTLVISINEIGACCLGGSCIGELYQSDCELLLGDYFGGGSDCDDDPAPCTILSGDECFTATQASLGMNFFDTTNATPSSGDPDETQCEGTYLDWNASPDIWLRWNAPDNGLVNFSTCDNDSFDTSIVLYENDCLNQIACNGDGEHDVGCQLYSSFIQRNVIAGNLYYIRIGGALGETGEGILTITYDFGACCIINNGIAMCIDTDTQNCLNHNGTFTYGVDCVDYICEQPECADAIFSQNPHDYYEDWLAGTSSIDTSGKIPFDYERAEFIGLDAPMSSLSVWGFSLTYTEVNDQNTWVPCEPEYLFTVRNYMESDEFNLPSGSPYKAANVEATVTSTGELYAGVFELKQWTMDFAVESVGHISVQSQSTGTDCWFLWMSSASGDGRSSFFDGTDWVISDTDLDLSICIKP